MALKPLLIMSLLSIAMAFPLAKAQAGGILGLISIQGIVFCSPNGNLSVNSTATQAFGNAQVHLQCGEQMVSTTISNGDGMFAMLIDPVQYLLSTLLSSCSLVVATPLSICNVSLPAFGGLVSALAFVGNTFLGTLLVANVVPAGFHFTPSI